MNNAIKTPFAVWLREFTKDKKLVSETEQSDTSAVHSIQRYIDQAGVLWEVAQTYTGRVVVRSGTTLNHGVTVHWNSWQTYHDVTLAPEAN